MSDPSADDAHIYKTFICRACGGKVVLYKANPYTIGNRCCLACCLGWNTRDRTNGVTEVKDTLISDEIEARGLIHEAADEEDN